MVYTLRFFSSKCSLFHNSNVFGSCFIHVLYTVCAKIKKNNSGAKRLIITHMILYSWVLGFLDMFIKLWKATIRFVTSAVCLPIHGEQLGTPTHTHTHTHKKRFSWTLKFYIWVLFENILRNFRYLQNLTIIMDTLHRDLCTFITISCSISLRMEVYQTKFLEKFKTCILLDHVAKYGRGRQATAGNRTHSTKDVIWMPNK